MSVLQIKNRTTDSQEEFDRHSLSSNSYIYTSAEEKNVEEFSIELTLGEGWNDNYSFKNKGLIKIEESITIQRHGSVVVEVKEDIRVPHNRYGIILPTGNTFLSWGIIIVSAKVEPAFFGRLKLRVFNTTNQKVVLHKGTKLGSIIFFPTESTKVHAAKYRDSEISAHLPSKFVELKKWLLSNKLIWIGWMVSFLTSSLAVFALTYVLFDKPAPERKGTHIQALEQVAPTPPVESNGK